MPMNKHTADKVVFFLYATLAMVCLNAELNWITWGLFPYVGFTIAGVLLIALFLFSKRDEMLMASPYDVALSLSILTIVALPTSSSIAAAATMFSVFIGSVLIVSLLMALWAAIFSK